jgi:NTE family protein
LKRTVSLVLSSGSARGIAHIGVIEELERQGFEIRSIAGSSMGALIGGMYASGNLHVCKDWLYNLDKRAVFSLIDFTISMNGIVKGNKIIRELKKIVPDVNIEDLPVSYAAVATDIRNNKEVIFEEGSLYQAIRASISIPGIFKPYELKEGMLIDGAVLNPIPINRVRRTPGDLLIAVDVSAPVLPIDTTESGMLPGWNHYPVTGSAAAGVNGNLVKSQTERQLNYYTLLFECCRSMTQQISAMMIEQYRPDILIQLQANAYGAFQFYKSGEIIKAGELATRNALREYQSKS